MYKIYYLSVSSIQCCFVAIKHYHPFICCWNLRLNPGTLAYYKSTLLMSYIPSPLYILQDLTRVATKLQTSGLRGTPGLPDTPLRGDSRPTVHLLVISVTCFYNHKQLTGTEHSSAVESLPGRQCPALPLQSEITPPVSLSHLHTI